MERALGEAEPQKILDLPCGFGRVTRVLRVRFPHASITACDLDREGVEFARRSSRAMPRS
ncbi:methyltransferase [Falsiroseomonas sp. HC035]|uniref:methyltransferase n=1 Tax=Falsiroseomonas sp. HC035 TaxID=3390999 RepID=UPI003D31333F